MNKQFNELYTIFTAYYGKPDWETKPKEGQDTDKIIEIWSNELSKYTLESVRESAYWIVRDKRLKTFPPLAVVLAELQNRERPLSPPEKQYNELLVYIRSIWPNISETERQWRCGRIIFETTGKEFGIYKRELDSGFESYSIPEFIKKRDKVI